MEFWDKIISYHLSRCKMCFLSLGTKNWFQHGMCVLASGIIFCFSGKKLLRQKEIFWSPFTAIPKHQLKGELIVAINFCYFTLCLCHFNCWNSKFSQQCFSFSLVWCLSGLVSRTGCGIWLYRFPITVFTSTWATSWQNQQNDCAPSEDSAQPVHPPSLIRVFTVRLMGS